MIIEVIAEILKILWICLAVATLFAIGWVIKQ